MRPKVVVAPNFSLAEFSPALKMPELTLGRRYKGHQGMWKVDYVLLHVLILLGHTHTVLFLLRYSGI